MEIGFNDKRSILYILSLVVIIGYIIDIIVSNNKIFHIIDLLSISISFIFLIFEYYSVTSTKISISIITYTLIFSVLFGYFSDIDINKDANVLHSSLIIGALLPFTGYTLGKRHTIYIGIILLLFNISVVYITENRYVSQNFHLLLLLLTGYVLGMYYLISIIEKGKINQRNFISGLEIQNNNNKFINSLAFKLAALSSDNDIIPVVLKSIKKHTHAALVAFSAYDPEKKVFTIKYIDTDGSTTGTIRDIIGKEIINTTSPVVSHMNYTTMMKRKIHKCYSLTEVSFGDMSEMINNKIKEDTGLSTYFGIAHFFNKNLYGSTLLAFNKTESLPTTYLLETYSHLVALSLRKNLAERSLQESEAKLRRITDHISDTIFTTDLKLNITYISPSIEKLTGERVDVHMKKKLAERFSSKSLKKIISGLKEEMRKEKETNADKNRTRFTNIEFYKADGSIIHTSVHSSFLRDSNGNPIGIQGIVRDITEKKQAENALRENEQKLKTIIETIPNLLFQLDNTGKFTSFYQPNKYKELYKLPAEFINKTVYEIFEPKLANKFHEAILQTLGYGNYELEYELGNNNPEYFLASFARLNEKEVIAIISDITERTQKKIELKKYSEDLKQVIADKDRFMQIISHDLRSPFQTLLGFSELLLENMGSYEMEEIHSYISLIKNTSQKTYELLGDLLLWSKAQSGNIPFEPQNLSLSNECLDVISELDTNAKKKNITINNIVGSNNQFIWADKNMLKTILRNLISNAIKFSYQDNSINISSTKQHNSITISVADNGVGISEENQTKLWNFTNPYTTFGTANEQGTGIGLLLCKEFVERHKGSIWVESNTGKGADFKFIIPDRFNIEN